MNVGTFKLPHSDPHGQIVFQAVREGLIPFKAESIYLYMDEDIDFRRYRLVAEVWFKDLWHIQHLELIDKDELLGDPDLAIAKLYPKFVQAFRNREDYALAPLIQLGEN